MTRNVYAEKAVEQIPRLLTLLDRNPLSRTYGCFHRDYWLYKTSDFPDAVRQFGVQALALAYAHEFPDSPYHHHPKIRDWTVAALTYWASIQHKEGSFDEFYPFERGWVGPSAFTTYAAVEAYRLLRSEIDPALKDGVEGAIARAAAFIARGETERDQLANHHAMAALAVWKAHTLLSEPKLGRGFERLWEGFRRLHNQSEGWSLEYDGPDPGYQSATVSFLAKIYVDNRDPALLDVIRQCVEFCSYFVYPDGHYGGMLGSRNTSHLYPHGFELMAAELPLAAAIAERTMLSLSTGHLVPPGIMSDRYVFYRVPELLLAYLDHTERPQAIERLPHERASFEIWLPDARINVTTRKRFYAVANLGKGGVLKVFGREADALLINDGGLLAQMADGRLITSQWIDPSHVCAVNESGWSVAGQMHAVPSDKPFNPVTGLLFRVLLLAVGWLPWAAHRLKGTIRNVLMLGSRPVPIRFHRRFQHDSTGVTVIDEVIHEGRTRLQALHIGDEFYVRYVPQSRFFQPHELASSRLDVDSADLAHDLRITRRIDFDPERKPQLSTTIERLGEGPQSSGSAGVSSHPSGVYAFDYHVGRKTKRQLMYRLRRRTDEVEQALRRSARELGTVIDVGTADGLMLGELERRLGGGRWIGVDLSNELIRTAPDTFGRVQADALSLPIVDSCADAVVATAIIEHVADPALLLKEAHRVLRPGGVLVVSTPDPTWERIATRLRLLRDAGHEQTLDLNTLCALAHTEGFRVESAYKFMFSPIGFPFEQMIEKIIRRLNLDAMLANQLLVARKSTTS